MADDAEAMQLEMGSELLSQARVVLDGGSGGEIRYLAARLSEALGDALRVAESRGRRLRKPSG